MATIGGTVLTLLDNAKRKDPNGKQADVAELLTQTNEFLEHQPFFEANQATGHRVTVRTGLPSTVWRKLNGGITPSKSTTAQLDETIGMLEALSVVDKDVAELDGDVSATRFSEAEAFLEAMSQNYAQTLIYGDTSVNPERFLGLAPRFSTISGATNGQNVISGGGSGSVNTSVWLCGWGKRSLFGTYPRGSTAGLTQRDMGLDFVQVSSATMGGDQLLAYREHFQWKCGLVVKDWRYVVRICNIDTTNLVAESSNADLIKLMSRSLDRIPSFGLCTPVFYCNRTVYSMLRIQALNKSNAALAVEPALSQFGTPIQGAMSFLGIPIRRVDQILNTEATIS